MGLQDFWGPLLAWDLFLGGAGAATYLVGMLAFGLAGRYRPLAKVGIYAGPPLVALGALLLLLDLGQPLRFWRVLLRPYSSMMSIGALLISLFLILGFIHILLSLLSRIGDKAEGWLGSITALVGIGVMLYTGLLLGMMKAVPFWNSPSVPLLFVLSALATGVGTVIVLANVIHWVRPTWIKVEEASESLAGLVPSVMALLVAELVVLFSALLLMSGSRVSAVESVAYLVAGGFAVAFWVGVVGVGLIVPLGLALWIVKRHGKLGPNGTLNATLLIAICLLVGGVLLRYAVLSAGVSVATTLGP